MAIEFRPVTASEMGQFGLVTSYAFAGEAGDGPENEFTKQVRPEWTLFAFDGAKLAATFATFPFTMGANGRALALGGVTAVSTQPEYRRQGLIRQLMTQAFQAMREKDQSVAALWASQAAIYQRYGYALSSIKRCYSIDTVDIHFFDGDRGSLPVTRINTLEGEKIADALYHEFIANRMGYLYRDKKLWQSRIFKEKKKAGPIHVAVAFEGKQSRGYMVYTMRHSKVGHGTRFQEIDVRDFAWLSIDAYRSLWSFLAKHDLVGKVSWKYAPLDDPAPDFFVEPRLLHIKNYEGIWFRIVDLAAAVEGRGYQVSDKLTLEIAGDEMCPWNNGTWQIDASPEGTKVTSTTAPPDVTLSIKAMASLYTGFREARRLSGWGLIKGEAAAIERLSQLFATRYAPHCPDSF
jgi:predicted acetyltransferase